MKAPGRSFLVVLGGFAVVANVWIPIGTASPATVSPDYSDWSAPTPLGPVINTGANEAGPTLSKDGLTLYFVSNRPGSLNMIGDLWFSKRNSVDEDWGAPTRLSDIVNSAAEEATPNLSRDGHWLFFMSKRPGSQANPMGVVGFDIWMSYREHVHDDFDWQTPVNLGPNVNSPSFDQSPFFFENEETGLRQLYFTRTNGLTGNDIFVSNQLPDGTFAPATLVSELNSVLSDAGTSITFDGHEIFFFTRRVAPGTVGLSDLWTATRKSVLDPWSALTPLGPVVNSAVLDFDPFIASDRETLYFASTRAGTQDLYKSTRTKKRHEN